MKIIQILNSPHWSAVSNYCVGVSAELIKLGHEVLIITESGKALEHAKQLGIPYDNRIKLSGRNPFNLLQAFKRMKKIFEEFQPDIVSAHMNEGAWMSGYIAKKFFPKAVVARIRTDATSPHGHFINRYVHHELTDYIVSGSEMHKKECCKNLAYPPEKIKVIYGSVDTEQFNPKPINESLQKELGINSNDFVVCLLGRLSPVKGHEYALKAISLLKDLPQKVKLLCVGYEAQRSFEWVKQEAASMGISDRVICLGQRKDLPEILNLINVGIISSLGSEANSRATLEYMACKKPVVATSVGVIPEIVIDGETGFLVKPGSAEALADAIRKLVLNPDLAQKFGATSLKRVKENFTIKQFGLKMEAFYKEIARKS